MSSSSRTWQVVAAAVQIVSLFSSFISLLYMLAQHSRNAGRIGQHENHDVHGPRQSAWQRLPPCHNVTVLPQEEDQRDDDVQFEESNDFHMFL
jgi:hypothetical protein